MTGLTTARRVSTGHQGLSCPQHMMTAVGFDHGAGHPLLLLYDAKASLGKNSSYFNDLWHNLFNPSIGLF